MALFVDEPENLGTQEELQRLKIEVFPFLTRKLAPFLLFDILPFSSDRAQLTGIMILADIKLDEALRCWSAKVGGG